MYLFVCLSVYLSTCLSASLQTKLFCETSLIFELDNIKNEAILRDFLNVWTWQRQKRSYSARLLHFSKLATSKTKQFCETSSIELWTWQRQKWSYSASLPHFSKLTTFLTIEFCETSFKNGKLSAELMASYQCVFAIFPVHLSKVYIAPATKKWCQVIQSAAPVSQNHLSKPEDLRLQNVTLLRKSAPGPPNSSDEDVSCTAPATENASLPHACHRFWECYKTLTFCSLLTRSTIPCACRAKRHLNAQKWSEALVFFIF